MVQALDWINDLLAQPTVRVVDPAPASLDQMLLWMRQFHLGRKRILDTHLAAIMHTAGVQRLLTSNPRDFSVFGVLQIISP